MQSPKLKVYCEPGAILPSRAHASDSGYDLTIIAEHSRLPNGVILYKTGLRLVPGPGYYTEIVARSSLMKFGYMLANSVGIIDNEYRGELLVALVAFNPRAEPLTLPLRAAQLIPRKIAQVELVDATAEGQELPESERGSGGFGSTG